MIDEIPIFKSILDIMGITYNSIDDTKRVVVNTGFLYGRMMISVVISLFSTRLILKALGEVDFGVFSLVGGVIGMLTFFNGAMSVSTQRYLSYYLGAQKREKLIQIFQSSLILHLLIGIFIVVILEVSGVFLFNGFLNIPVERLHSAKIVFQFMIISTFFTINAVPYDASINAHENMLFVAITGILESFLKLGIAIWLVYASYDKLILYGFLFAIMTISLRIIKSFYCSLKYAECKFTFPIKVDKRLLKEMSSFAGWNLFGSLCDVVKSQGLPIILNLFFGVVVNAAYGIANQINWQLMSFSANLIKALNPQIAKSEGSGNRERMLRLAMLASKSSFLLISFFSVSLIIEMPYVLELWLKDYPNYAVIFTRLILIVSLVQQFTVGLMRAVQSVGKIKNYQIVIGTLLLLNLPLAYLLIRLGFPAYSVLLGSVFLEILAGLIRIVFAKLLTGLKIKIYLLDVVFKPFAAVIISFVIAYSPHFFLPKGFNRLMLTVFLSVSALYLLINRFVLSYYEKERISYVVHSVRNKIGL